MSACVKAECDACQSFTFKQKHWNHNLSLLRPSATSDITSVALVKMAAFYFSLLLSALGSGATDAELAVAAAPLLSVAFSFLSWLSILACSCFTNSSSSA